MTSLPNSLTYFANLNLLGQIINRMSLPVVDAEKLDDPFLPDASSALDFTLEDLFESAIKSISQAILGRNAPRGQPNHPLQKAILRWRMEDRFNDESEIRGALQGLLPAMVEQAFSEANDSHREWVEYVSSRRIARFFEKHQDLNLWLSQLPNHRGAALKFRGDEESIFQYARPARYTRHPAKTVPKNDYIEHMMGSMPNIEFDPESILLSQNYALRSQKEWRLLMNSNESDEQWAEFPAGLLQSIYLGLLVPEKHARQLVKHLAKVAPHVRVYQSGCKSNEFALDFERISEHGEEEPAAK